jgi:hypothetical protein
VVADSTRVIAVDPADGRERWSVALPPFPDADEYTGAPWPEIAALAGDGGLWIGDSEARFFRVVPGPLRAQHGEEAGEPAAWSRRGR